MTGYLLLDIILIIVAVILWMIALNKCLEKVWEEERQRLLKEKDKD